jgi:hypothetical protein
MYEKRVIKPYTREMLGALAVYIALLWAANRFGVELTNDVLRTLVLISPMIGFGLMIWAITRHLGRIDEYQRRRLLEEIALGAAITAGLTFTYGFLESAGYPRLSMFIVWCVLCGTTGIIHCVRAAFNK